MTKTVLVASVEVYGKCKSEEGKRWKQRYLYPGMRSHDSSKHVRYETATVQVRLVVSVTNDFDGSDCAR